MNLSSFSKRTQFIVVMLLSATIVVVVGLVVSFQLSPPPQTAVNSPPPAPSIPAPPPLPTVPLATPTPEPLASPPVVVPSTAAVPVTPPPAAAPEISQPVQEVKQGHLAYQENDPARLVVVGSYVRGDYERTELLDYEAAESFHRMAAAARAEGIQLMPISGFRTIADQQKLFDRQIQRQGSVEAAAKLSAPPGHSEHHTGYAIDIADVTRPDTDLKYALEETEAYRWLTNHAHEYGFELSFPPGNWQQVSFEPWHWRYVGSPRAQAIFATK